jgi:hypothetical protein
VKIVKLFNCEGIYSCIFFRSQYVLKKKEQIPGSPSLAEWEECIRIFSISSPQRVRIYLEIGRHHNQSMPQVLNPTII